MLALKLKQRPAAACAERTQPSSPNQSPSVHKGYWVGTGGTGPSTHLTVRTVNGKGKNKKVRSTRCFII